MPSPSIRETVYLPSLPFWPGNVPAWLEANLIDYKARISPGDSCSSCCWHARIRSRLVQASWWWCMQLTNAGLEICWKRVVRMHWRAGAAKERPASILRDVYACRRVYGRGRGWLEVLICKQKQQSPKQKPGAHGDLPRELSLHGSELASQGLAGFVRVTWEHFSLPFSLLRYTMFHCLGELTLVLLQWQGECVMYLCC